MRAAPLTCVVLTCVVQLIHKTRCEQTDDSGMSEDRRKLMASLEEMEKNLPTMDYKDQTGFENYIHNLSQAVAENDTHHKLEGVEFGNRTVDDDLYKAVHNIRIEPDYNLYPPGFDFFNYSGYVRGMGKGRVTDADGKTVEQLNFKAIMDEIKEEEEQEKRRDPGGHAWKEKDKRDKEETVEDDTEELREKVKKEEAKRKESAKAMENMDQELREMEEVEKWKRRIEGLENEVKYKVGNKTKEWKRKIDEGKLGEVEKKNHKTTVHDTTLDNEGQKVNAKGEKEIGVENMKEPVLHEKEDKEIDAKVENMEKEKNKTEGAQEEGKTQVEGRDNFTKGTKINEEQTKITHHKEKRKRRQVVLKDAEKEEKINDFLRNMIVDDKYLKQMDELKTKLNDKAHIKNYLYINFEHKDWYKRYKRDLNEAFNELNIDVNDPKLFGSNIFSDTMNQENHFRHHRSKRSLDDHEKEKDDFTKQLANFEINQANIKGLIDKGIGLNMQKAMKLSIDFSLKSYVNESSSLDESVQRFFIMKQEYMNLIDKWYHGVVIDLPNYLKSQERKKINLSYDDDQPSPEEREKLNKLNEYERVVDKEFAEVGIHYGKTLLNNYCDMDDLFYKYHRENNKVDIKTVFSEENTRELLKKEKIAS